MHRKFQEGLESSGSRLLVLVLAGRLGQGVALQAAQPFSPLGHSAGVAACLQLGISYANQQPRGVCDGVPAPGTGRCGLRFRGTKQE